MKTSAVRFFAAASATAVLCIALWLTTGGAAGLYAAELAQGVNPCGANADDNCVDFGNEADEAFHSLSGWGDSSTSPGSTESDKTMRYQSIRREQSFRLRLPNLSSSYYEYHITFEDGSCDDSWSFFVNSKGTGPTHKALPGPTRVWNVVGQIPASYVNSPDVTLSFRNEATDSCGSAAIFYVTLKPADASSCSVPFFWQRDPNWSGHPLRTGGACSADYGTIGQGGCTLTSSAMLFRYYGAAKTSSGQEMNPANLSDCMDKNACPFAWYTGAACSSGKATFSRKMAFSWEQLDRELNQNGRPVILGMHKKGSSGDTHWVLVLSGSGSDPANYTIHDPWFEGGANDKLDARARTSDFDSIVVYSGAACQSTAEVKQQFAPQPTAVRFRPGEALHAQNEAPAPAGSSALLTGTVWVYEMTAVTMTVKVAPPVTATEMLIWTDKMSNTTWQPVEEFSWLPVSDFVYAQFRDAAGNISLEAVDTINPSGPPTAAGPVEMFLPAVFNTLNPE